MGLEKEKISIITASYNYERFIQETIESVLAQTYTNWELIIVDDGSKDNSIEVIQKYCQKDDRIKLYTHENNANKGLAETIKLGLSKCSSNWVAFLESDDIFMPDSIEEKVKIAQKYPDIAIIFSDIEHFGCEEIIKRDEQFFSDLKQLLLKFKYPANIAKHMFKDNLIPTFSAVMVNKSLLEKCDFQSPVKACLDWYIWAQLVHKKVYYIDKKLTKWRIHNQSYINSVDTLSDDFRIKIGAMIVKNNKMLFPKYLRYLKRKLIKLHLNKDPQIWIMGKPLLKKNKQDL